MVEAFNWVIAVSRYDSGMEEKIMRCIFTIITLWLLAIARAMPRFDPDSTWTRL
jgi:hypothetical protein